MSKTFFLNGHKSAQNVLDKPWNVVQQYRLISATYALNHNELLPSGSELTTAKYKPWKPKVTRLKQNGVESLNNFVKG